MSQRLVYTKVVDVYEGKTVAVVIPAYNEEKLIGQVITTMPEFVDLIIVVNDASTDETKERVEWYANSLGERLHLISHAHNQGVGAAVASGYKEALSRQCDVVAVVDGDAQMDPDDLQRVLAPIAHNQVDYVKGNRLFRGESWDMIPHYRYLGNAILSLLTKIASGYWHIADSQCGYTAISHAALKAIDLDNLYPRYGVYNDILVKLNARNFRVCNVSVRPIYNIGEASGIRLKKVIPTISKLLIRGFCWRLLVKYILLDFHPLVFFYFMGLVLLPSGMLFGSYLLWYRIFIGPMAATSALFASLLIISGLQSLFFAMWFDMDYNKHLK